MLTAEIIAVGSELLTPFRTDTNSLWLTDRLNSVGVEVRLKTIVGDDDARLEETIRDAVKRSGVVVLTGGLGPTEDDITRKIAARALGRRLLLDEKVLEEIKAKFLRWGRKMPEINARQAMVMEGAEVLNNPNGSAPGMYVEHDGRVVVLLPGPPREMKPMFDGLVLPKLAERSGGVRVVRRVLRVAGLGESAVDERIAPVYTQYKNPQTTILFNSTEIEIHLTAQGQTESEAELLLDGLAGLVAHRLTEVPGSSTYFMEGVVTYSNEAKTRLLGVPAELIQTHGAVSGEVAEAMARGAKERAGTDFGLSVTGIAGPGGGSEEKPVGLVYVALADDAHVEHKRLMLPGDRYLIRTRASQFALDLLRRRLI